MVLLHLAYLPSFLVCVNVPVQSLIVGRIRLTKGKLAPISETPMDFYHSSPTCNKNIWRDIRGGLPWWLSGWESTIQAAWVHPGPGRSHVPRSGWGCALQRLSPHSGPARHNSWGLCAWSLCSTQRDVVIMRSLCTATQGGPPLTMARQSPWAITETQQSHE